SSALAQSSSTPPAGAPPSASASVAEGVPVSRRDFARAPLEDLANEGAHRTMTLEIAPLGPFVGQWGGSIEILPVRHHALVLSPYYFASRTDADPANGVPRSNFFRGIAGEIGYRYYTGGSGPRGIFLGPSLLLGAFTAQGSGAPGQPDPQA